MYPKLGSADVVRSAPLGENGKAHQARRYVNELGECSVACPLPDSRKIDKAHLQREGNVWDGYA